MIIDFRWFKFGQNIVQEALVEWHKLLEEGAMWELYEDLQCQVSWMNLEDKIYLLWGGTGGMHDQEVTLHDCACLHGHSQGGFLD